MPLALEDFRRDMEGCSRCSSCKWIPLSQIRSKRFSQVCPSISKFKFHAYSGSGKLNTGLSIIDGRSEFDEAAADIFYKCTMCGGCDVGCKVYRNDIDLTDTFAEARARAVELGHAPIELLMLVENMNAENNVFGEPKDARADWEAETGVELLDANAEQVDILLHVGCRLAYDTALRPEIAAAARILQKTGLKVGTSKTAESCCGFRAYESGFKSELAKFSDDMVNRVKSCGAKMVAVACSDCFGAFNYVYPKNGRALPVPVRHIAEIADEMAGGAGRETAKTAAAVSIRPADAGRGGETRTRKVTYHDPCNLGRKGQDFTGQYEGNKLDRPDEMRRAGQGGRYDEPRRLIESIPGVELVEMERIREYSWCCGAGGGCYESQEEFSLETAKERIEEAIATGADTLVTSCPWCVNNFNLAIEAMETGAIEVVGISQFIEEAFS
ncbi:MAG: hypothetical protein DCC49_11765 [Acidobacteria bacterium]|nr:MAG: hypothetical protein DCC49_11765 [Acidobacteriota bacterium]